MIKVYDEVFFFEKVRIGDSFRPHTIAYIIVYQGTMVIELNGIESIYNAGSIAVISRENLYKINDLTTDLLVYIISADREKVRQKINLNFNRYDVYRIAFLEKKSALLEFDDIEFENILNWTRQLSFYTSEGAHVLFYKEVIVSLFSAIVYITVGKLLQNSDRTQTNNSRKEEITMLFIEILSYNFKAEKELKFYADKLCISVKYLSNCVREITGVPPSRFIDDALINESKALLLNSKDTINIISGKLGFSDQYAFGKFFKKYTGFSPKNFKTYNKLVETF